jgi:hypothetical protein
MHSTPSYEGPHETLPEPLTPDPIPGTELSKLAEQVVSAVKSQLSAQRGRPPSADRVRLEGAASMWLDSNGTPTKQADLEDVLASWCLLVGIELGDRTIRTVAATAIREHKERRNRLN